MIRKVITYPNPLLREVSKDVTVFDETLHTLLDDMYDTMIEKNGIGLAAIQVAVPLNALVINLPRESEDGESYLDKEDLVEYINPVILEEDGSCVHQEGCLSVPDVYEDVQRAEVVKVKYNDRYGKEYIEVHTGLASIAIQHEIDHLRGHLFIEKLSYLKRQKFEKEWKRRLKEQKSKIKSKAKIDS